MDVDTNSLALQELTKIVTDIPFNRHLGLRLNHIANDYISMGFDMKPELIGNYLHGILHGGVISSVLDMAGGFAAMVSIIQKQEGKTFEEVAAKISKASTIDLSINYIRPGKGSHFAAKAKVVHAGNKICFASMELFNDQEQLIATGTGTYLVG